MRVDLEGFEDFGVGQGQVTAAHSCQYCLAFNTHDHALHGEVTKKLQVKPILGH